MPPYRAYEADIRRSDFGTRWRRKLLLWSLISLACAGPECAAFAQDDQNPAAQNRQLPAAIRHQCSADHTRYCIHEAAGTSADMACLQQHHLNLSVKCRDQLQPPGGGMPDAELGTR